MAFLGGAGTYGVEPVVVQVGVGQARVACTSALLAAVDVRPDGERVECHLSQRAGTIGDAISRELRCQVVTVAPARFAALTLQAFPVIRGAGSIEDAAHDLLKILRSNYGSPFLAGVALTGTSPWAPSPGSVRRGLRRQGRLC